MSIPATAADITTHDEWIAFHNAPENISAFARTIVGEKLLADAAAGDYHDQVMVAYEVKAVMRLEAMTDVELEVEHSHNRAAHLANLDWDEYDLNDRESYYYEQGLIEALLEHRRVFRQYTGHGPLTHRPFAALAV
jgi:hypothetical protein